MSTPEQQPESQFNVVVPADMAAGVYASFAQVWADEAVFTIDFAARTEPPTPVSDEETGAQVYLHNCQVVARVRIPPAQVWELARALTQTLASWEEVTGRTAEQAGPESG